ncbi:MAG: DUF47 family protein [Clostridiales bacterium]|nr:DUF47 family protein [Clostridiales bacterium]
MKRKNEYNYYNEFIKLSEYSLKSANFLHDTLCNFSSKNLASKIKEMHDIELGADQVRNLIIRHLAREFLPPMERQDIYNLTERLDDITDSIEELLICFDIFNIQSISIEILKFTTLIVNCCTTLHETLKEFRNFKTSKILNNNLVKINEIKDLGYTLYMDSIRNLYRNTKDPVQIICWTEILNHFKQTCSHCEHLALTLESIIINNT